MSKHVSMRIHLHKEAARDPLRRDYQQANMLTTPPMEVRSSVILIIIHGKEAECFTDFLENTPASASRLNSEQIGSHRAPRRKKVR